MIFSEWDEAWTDQDPQKENKTLYQQPIIKDTNILFLLDIAKLLNRYITNLEKEYGIKAAELAKVPYDRLIDTCEVTALDIKPSNIKYLKSNVWKEKILHDFVIVK